MYLLHRTYNRKCTLLRDVQREQISDIVQVHEALTSQTPSITQVVLPNRFVDSLPFVDNTFTTTNLMMLWLFCAWVLRVCWGYTTSFAYATCLYTARCSGYRWARTSRFLSRPIHMVERLISKGWSYIRLMYPVRRGKTDCTIQEYTPNDIGNITNMNASMLSSEGHDVKVVADRDLGPTDKGGLEIGSGASGLGCSEELGTVISYSVNGTTHNDSAIDEMSFMTVKLDKKMLVETVPYIYEPSAIESHTDDDGVVLVHYKDTISGKVRYTTLKHRQAHLLPKLHHIGVQNVVVADVSLFPKNTEPIVRGLTQLLPTSFSCQDDPNMYVKMMYDIRKLVSVKPDFGKYLKCVLEYMYTNFEYDATASCSPISIRDVYEGFTKFNVSRFRSDICHAISSNKFIVYLMYLGFEVQDNKLMHRRRVQAQKRITIAPSVALDKLKPNSTYHLKKNVGLRSVPPVDYKTCSPWNQVDFGKHTE